MQSLKTLLHDHRDTLLQQDRHAASLEGSFSPTIETDILNGQIEDVDFDCDCGGTFDADGLCSDCDNGHDDCDQSCFACFERSVSRAEAAYEGDR